MLRRAACLLVLLFISSGAVLGQRAPEEVPRQPRILLLLDGSSSMLQPWGSNSIRFKAAAKVISALMDSIYAVNRGVEFGLRVYGHQSPAQDNDCYDTRQEVMFSKNNETQMGLRLASLHPFGVSPIAYSLSEAASNDLVDEVRNAYSIILITDGGESCGGDICDVVQKLIERKIFFKPYILSLVESTTMRQQYNCLGTYLQIAKEKDITPAINTIVEAYRPLLSMPIMAVKVDPVPVTPKVKPVTVTVPALPIPTPSPTPAPAPARDRSVIASMPAAASTTFPVLRKIPRLGGIAAQHYTAVAKPAPEPVVIPPAPKRDTLLVMKAKPVVASPVVKNAPVIIANTRPVPLPTVAPSPAPKRDTLKVIAARPAVATVVKKDAVAITKAQPVPVPAVTPSPVPKPDTATRTVSVIKKLTPIPAAVPKPHPVAIASNKPKETPFTITAEDAKTTTLEILFTDGRGKFYPTSPKLQLIDAGTNKLVKAFYRTVDPTGNPDPQDIPAGTYNLLVAGGSNMLMRQVVVQPNKKNRVTVKVSNGSLRFRYEDAPGRPVTEFDAIVNIRFEPGPTIKQRCTAELEYAPGNYYIEVNTMPISRFNTDIDFGAITEIQLPQPGYVQITNTSPKGMVSFYAPLGNRFVRFIDVNVSGNQTAQRLQLKPGAYEVHWKKNPNSPFATETIDRFNVQSNSVTEVELH